MRENVAGVDHSSYIRLDIRDTKSTAIVCSAAEPSTPTPGTKSRSVKRRYKRRAAGARDARRKHSRGCDYSLGVQVTKSGGDCATLTRAARESKQRRQNNARLLHYKLTSTLH